MVGRAFCGLGQHMFTFWHGTHFGNAIPYRLAGHLYHVRLHRYYACVFS
jgi:hypothetical protein